MAAEPPQGFALPHREGCVLGFKVIPSASSNRVCGLHGGTAVKVKIAAPPEKGKANRELISFVSRLLGIPRSRISILSGETSPLKKLLLKGIRPNEAAESISSLF